MEKNEKKSNLKVVSTYKSSMKDIGKEGKYLAYLIMRGDEFPVKLVFGGTCVTQEMLDEVCKMFSPCSNWEEMKGKDVEALLFKTKVLGIRNPFETMGFIKLDLFRGYPS